jgi:hypothetical protein
MTYEEMIEAIEAAPPAEKLATAERVLAEYQGDDKDFIAPDIMEMAALEQDP